MGNKRFLLVSFVLAALVGCDQGNEKGSAPAVQNSDATSTTSSTALYLPGGLGIDFGIPPLQDRVVDDKGAQLRVVTYHLNSEVADIDSAVSAILQSAGYKRTEGAKGSNDLSVTYRNSSDRVLFRYKSQVSEGFTKNTRLYVSWRL